MNETGVAVFAYNRPNHLERVLCGLRENEVEHIYFFSDGAKGRDDQENVQSVRDVIDGVDWCNKTVTERNRNIGLSKSIVSGVKRVFEEHDQAIILEDDCVPSANFMDFMTSCLEKYSGHERVMNVNGFSPPIDIPQDYPHEVYFTYRSSSWGWGTWKRAWKHFEQDPISLKELEANEKELKRITRNAGKDLYPMMRMQLNGEIDSWAVWWSFAIAAAGGVCVNPVNSQIQNIGVDGTGTHVGSSNRYQVDIDDRTEDVLNLPDKVVVNSKINSRHNQFITGGRRQKFSHMARMIMERVGLWDAYMKFTD